MAHDARDIQQLRDHCKHCQKGHGVVEFLDEFLPTLDDNNRALDVVSEIDGAQVTITVELDIDGDGRWSVVGPVYAETERGGLISRQALLDLGYSRGVLRDMIRAGGRDG